MQQVEKVTVLYIKKPLTTARELSFEEADGDIQVDILVKVLPKFSLDKLEELIDTHEPALVFIDSDDFEEVFEIALGTFKDIGVDFQFSDGTCIPTWGHDEDDYLN